MNDSQKDYETLFFKGQNWDIFPGSGGDICIDLLFGCGAED